MAPSKKPAQPPQAPPAWYWVRGLHDAGITEVEAFDFPFDYNRFSGQKDVYDRNLLTLRLDSKGAMYDTSVKEIRFYNYKILTPDVSLENREMIWWLSDRLLISDGHFVLEMDLQDFHSYPEDFTFRIKFERAEVLR